MKTENISEHAGIISEQIYLNIGFIISVTQKQECLDMEIINEQQPPLRNKMIIF